MKCQVCRGPGVIDLPRHNAKFCGDHFVRFCEEQVATAIRRHRMIASGERVLVAVSGGKDSLALWDLLLRQGFAADGLYLGLGIGDYSDESGDYARAFARSRDARLIEVDLRAEHGFDVITAADASGRAPCSACGLSKRHLFDDAARRGGYDVVATGHNLDDEAAVLFGNVLRWELEYLARQAPVLAARDGLPRKVKPLVRLTEREMAAYCIVRGIDYQVDECPMAAGNKHLEYKAALNEIEIVSPGAKFTFYEGFLRKLAPLLAEVAVADRAGLGPCSQCGAVTSGDVCAFCKLGHAVVRAGDRSANGPSIGASTPVAAPRRRSRAAGRTRP
jgi:uncharacterized protein (TIGR00269 family)